MNELAKMNTNQVKALQEKTNLVFLPIGPTEVHAQHLPMTADVICALEMSRLAAEKLELQGVASLIATPIPYCLADAANCFVGNTTLRAETVAALVEDVCVSLAKWGFNKVVVVCGHGEGPNLDAIMQGIEQAKMRDASVEGMISEWFTKGMPLMNGVLRGEHPEWDLHAGELETGQIMYIHPELVDVEALQKLEPNWNGETLFEKLEAGAETFIEAGAPLAYFGDPRIATAAVGRKATDVFADYIVDEVQAFIK